jgi:hypothetical protein
MGPLCEVASVIIRAGPSTQKSITTAFADKLRWGCLPLMVLHARSRGAALQYKTETHAQLLPNDYIGNASDAFFRIYTAFSVSQAALYVL